MYLALLSHGNRKRPIYLKLSILGRNESQITKKHCLWSIDLNFLLSGFNSPVHENHAWLPLYEGLSPKCLQFLQIFGTSPPLPNFYMSTTWMTSIFVLPLCSFSRQWSVSFGKGIGWRMKATATSTVGSTSVSAGCWVRSLWLNDYALDTYPMG